MRHLAAMPLFTGMAVLTLALGIGANTAIFSVISGVLLKPLPYPRSDEIVALDHAAPGFDIPRAGAAPFLYFTYREDGQVFQDVALWNTGTVSVTGLAQPEEVRTLFATDGLLPILGVQPMLGRVFSRADDAARRHRHGGAHGGLLANRSSAAIGRPSAGRSRWTAVRARSSACCPTRSASSTATCRWWCRCGSIAARSCSASSATQAIGAPEARARRSSGPTPTRPA